MNKLVASVAVAASVILPMAAFDLQREIDAALGNAACGAEFALGVGAYEGRAAKGHLGCHGRQGVYSAAFARLPGVLRLVIRIGRLWNNI